MLSKAHITQFAQISFVIAPAFVLYGYNQAVLSALLDLPDVVHHFPQIDTTNTKGAQEASNSTKQGVVNACFQLGALMGSLSCSFIGDVLGRRKAIFIAAILTLISQALQCSAFALTQLVIGRVILGIGVGQMSVTVPVWQSESSSASNRGRQVITAGIFICVGFALSSWVNFGFSKISFPPLQWRIPLVIPTLFSLLICVSIFTLPESPRWLVQKGRVLEASDVLAVLKGLPRDDAQIQSEVVQIDGSLETSRGSSLKDIFDSNDRSRLGYRFTLCLLVQFAQQMTSGNLISIYTTTIFEDNLHLQGDLPRILAATSLTWKLLCSFIAFAAIDRLGRRMLVVISGTGMSLCMIAMALQPAFKPTLPLSLLQFLSLSSTSVIRSGFWEATSCTAPRSPPFVSVSP